MNDIVVHLYLTRKSDQQLLSQFLEELGYEVDISNSIAIKEWLNNSIIILDEISASRIGQDLLDIKQKLGPLFLPTVILLSQKSNDLLWHKLGFDAVLQLPSQKRAIASQLSMLSRIKNPRAIIFYKKMGFKIIGRSEFDGQNKPRPLLHMGFSF